MEPEIIRADPAGNITIFVLNAQGSQKEKEELAKKLLKNKELEAEQVGFVFPPAESGGLWRLEMMGGEFCGNASRSLGLLIAEKTGLSGKHTLTIETSGAAAPVQVYIDTDAQTAEIEIPKPVKETEIVLGKSSFPVYIFEGITHAIAEDIQADEKTALELIDKIKKYLKEEQGAGGAIGVMFYDTQKCFLRPAVWTRAMDSLIFESSCGSGSAALGVRVIQNLTNAEIKMDISQPGGILTVHAKKHDGEITKLSISGKVTLSKTAY